MTGALRIDWLPFVVMFLALAIMVGGTRIGLCALFTRIAGFLGKCEQRTTPNALRSGATRVDSRRIVAATGGIEPPTRGFSGSDDREYS